MRTSLNWVKECENTNDWDWFQGLKGWLLIHRTRLSPPSPFLPGRSVKSQLLVPACLACLHLERRRTRRTERDKASDSGWRSRGLPCLGSCPETAAVFQLANVTSHRPAPPELQGPWEGERVAGLVEAGCQSPVSGWGGGEGVAHVGGCCWYSSWPGNFSIMHNTLHIWQRHNSARPRWPLVWRQFPEMEANGPCFRTGGVERSRWCQPFLQNEWGKEIFPCGLTTILLMINIRLAEWLSRSGAI